MNTTKTIRSLAALLCLQTLATAQILGGAIGGTTGTMSSGSTTLPDVQSRVGSYTTSIGNDWLGGSVRAAASMLRQRQGTYELGMLSAELRGTAKVLRYSQEVAEAVASATNVMNNGVQSRSALFRVEMLGYPVINSSFVNSSTFLQRTWTFNLFPGTGVGASVPVGPISVSIRGNAGCSLGATANFLLPAYTASVSLTGNGTAYAMANASVSAGVPGFNVGVGIQGRILEQTLAINLGANARTGLFGSVTYTLNAISLRLYAWATALYRWETTLCTWAATALTRTIV